MLQKLRDRGGSDPWPGQFWTLDSLYLPLPKLLLSPPYTGLCVSVPSRSRATEGSSHEAEGLSEAQMLGPGRGDQARCYGERNVMQLTCLTGGLEKYPCPSGASEPSITPERLLS